MGDNFEKKISLISEEEVFLKPLPFIHSVAEIITHLTAWNEDLIKKIQNGIGELKDGDPRNWRSNEELKEAGWISIWSAYKSSYQNVIQLLKAKNDDFLHEVYFDQDFDSERKYVFAVDGILQHAIYHLGQIGLIIRLIKENR